MNAYAPLTDSDRADIAEFLAHGSRMPACLLEVSRDLDNVVGRLIEIGLPDVEEWLNEAHFQAVMRRAS